MIEGYGGVGLRPGASTVVCRRGFAILGRCERCSAGISAGRLEGTVDTVAAE